MTASRPSVALIVPALNEEHTIGAVVAEARPHLDALSGEVIVVDNGSTDATRARALEAGARVVLAREPGYGRACMTGVAETDAAILVFMDGDGSDMPAHIPALLDAIDRGADLALGVRRGSGVQSGSMTLPARFGNALSSWLLAAMYGRRVHDLSPLKAMRRDFLDRVAPREMTYGWTVEVIGSALRAGAAIEEIDVGYRRRAGGTSKVSGDLRAAARAGVRILATIARLAVGRPRRGAAGGLLGATIAILVLIGMGAWLASVPGTGARAAATIWLLAWPLLFAGVGLGVAVELLASSKGDTERIERARAENTEDHRAVL